MLSRAMAFVRLEVSEAWKRPKVKNVGKTVAGAKINIESKRCTNEKPGMKKIVKKALINVFQLEFGSVSALGDKLRSFV